MSPCEILRLLIYLKPLVSELPCFMRVHFKFVRERTCSFEASACVVSKFFCKSLSIYSSIFGVNTVSSPHIFQSLHEVAKIFYELSQMVVSERV